VWGVSAMDRTKSAEFDDVWQRLLLWVTTWSTHHRGAAQLVLQDMFMAVSLRRAYLVLFTPSPVIANTLST